MYRIQHNDNMMHANTYANIYNHIIIINAINKAAKATKTILESARIDSLREDGPAIGQLLYPQQSRQLSHPRKTTGGLKQKKGSGKN